MPDGTLSGDWFTFAVVHPTPHIQLEERSKSVVIMNSNCFETSDGVLVASLNGRNITVILFNSSGCSSIVEWMADSKVIEIIIVCNNDRQIFVIAATLENYLIGCLNKEINPSKVYRLIKHNKKNAADAKFLYCASAQSLLSISPEEITMFSMKDGGITSHDNIKHLSLKLDETKMYSPIHSDLFEIVGAESVTALYPFIALILKS